MIKSLLKIALILVVGILVYNRYFGTDVEKAQAKEVFGSVKGVVKSVAGIMRTEKDKFDAGKYDKVMDKLGGAYQAVREKAQFLDDKVLSQLSDLEQRKKALEAEIDDLKSDEDSTSTTDNKGIRGEANSDGVSAAKEASKKDRQRKIQKEMEQLLKETESLLEEAEREQE